MIFESAKDWAESHFVYRCLHHRRTSQMPLKG